jgi:hypothetical protein
MSEQNLRYPKAKAAFGAGDLQDVYDVNLANTDGRKLVATLRRNPAGWTEGARSTNLTLKSAISEEGFERSYLKKWQKGDTVQIRVKVPGQTLVVEGVLTNPIVTSNVDNFIDFTISLLGAFGFD